jgi:hypothetical protein
MRFRCVFVQMLIFALGVAIALASLAQLRRSSQDLPWSQLDLTEPFGAFTGRKLAGLTRDAPRCLSLMALAGIHYTALPPVRAEQCGYDDAVRFIAGGPRTIAFTPPVGTSCPVAAGLALWEWHVVQPAALRHFGQHVTSIDHYGSFSCRRMYGRSSGDWSEHATADAIDIAGFTLERGVHIRVRRDWRGERRRAAFLRDVRDGACKLFSSVLSPDYNLAHADHLHLDQAERGEKSWRICA